MSSEYSKKEFLSECLMAGIAVLEVDVFTGPPKYSEDKEECENWTGRRWVVVDVPKEDQEVISLDGRFGRFRGEMVRLFETPDDALESRSDFAYAPPGTTEITKMVFDRDLGVMVEA